MTLRFTYVSSNRHRRVYCFAKATTRIWMDICTVEMQWRSTHLASLSAELQVRPEGLVIPCEHRQGLASTTEETAQPQTESIDPKRLCQGFGALLIIWNCNKELLSERVEKEGGFVRTMLCTNHNVCNTMLRNTAVQHRFIEEMVLTSCCSRFAWCKTA